jgi:(2Fe-2S) ferredoxin
MNDALQAGFRKAAVATAERHIFLCMGPDCCEPEEAQIVWDYIKRRVSETGIRAMRTKAQCFRICTGGPWLVVYPEGVWYGDMTVERFERILHEHLIGNAPVTEWIAARNCLGSHTEG